MWHAIKEICAIEKCNRNDLITLIAFKKSDDMSLAAAVRVFCMLYFRSASSQAGHVKAGHGSFKEMVERSSRKKNNLPNEFLTIHLSKEEK